MLKYWEVTSITRGKKRRAWFHILSLSSGGRRGNRVKVSAMMIKGVVGGGMVMSWL